MTPEDFLNRYKSALGTQKRENVEPPINERCVLTFSNGTFIGKAEAERIFRMNFELIRESELTGTTFS